MTDIATITTFLGSIKTAAELAKAISGADTLLERAELRLKIAELLEAIADAKIQALNIKELLDEKDRAIHELTEKLDGKQQQIRKDGMHFEIDDDGNPKGDPYCSHCWESAGKRIHLGNVGGLRICHACKAVLTS